MQDKGSQHVALSSAAAVIYRQMGGEEALKIGEAGELDEILNRVANALANVTIIYTADRAAGGPRQLAPIELIHCRFEQGATVLKTSFGVEYRDLTIRRDDMLSALAILKGAGVDFRRKPRRS